MELKNPWWQPHLQPLNSVSVGSTSVSLAAMAGTPWTVHFQNIHVWRFKKSRWQGWFSFWHHRCNFLANLSQISKENWDPQASCGSWGSQALLFPWKQRLWSLSLEPTCLHWKGLETSLMAESRFTTSGTGCPQVSKTQTYQSWSSAISSIFTLKVRTAAVSSSHGMVIDFSGMTLSLPDKNEMWMRFMQFISLM